MPFLSKVQKLVPSLVAKWGDCYPDPLALKTVWVSLSDTELKVYHSHGVEISAGPCFMEARQLREIKLNPVQTNRVYDITLTDVYKAVIILWPRPSSLHHTFLTT